MQIAGDAGSGSAPEPRRQDAEYDGRVGAVGLIRGKHVVCGVDRHGQATVVRDGAVAHADGWIVEVGESDVGMRVSFCVNLRDQNRLAYEDDQGWLDGAR